MTRPEARQQLGAEGIPLLRGECHVAQGDLPLSREGLGEGRTAAVAGGPGAFAGNGVAAGHHVKAAGVAAGADLGGARVHDHVPDLACPALSPAIKAAVADEASTESLAELQIDEV